MRLTRQNVIDLMRRVGLHDQVPEALRVLPDEVDTQRDKALLEGLGLHRQQLVEQLGSSP